MFHCAAQAIVGTANRNPLSTWESNVRGTYNLLEACRRNAKLVTRVVVASSDKAYGDQLKLPYTEDTPLEGRFPYDASKSCTDLITRSYFETYQVPACITRCGNLFGPGDLNWNRIVPGTIRSALRESAAGPLSSSVLRSILRPSWRRARSRCFALRFIVGV